MKYRTNAFANLNWRQPCEVMERVLSKYFRRARLINEFLLRECERDRNIFEI